MFSQLREDIASIRARDPAARNAWEVVSCYPGLHAMVMHRWANACWQGGLKWLARFIAHLARAMTGIEIHPGATIGRRLFIDHGFGVVIGETAVIGDDCTIYQGVTLGGTSLSKGAKRHPTLGQGVIVGAGAKVLGGFVVGDGAKIGSNAVLTRALPAGATAVGNPARIIQRSGPQDSQGQQATPAAQAPADPRQRAAARLFAAYGVVPDGDDPLSKALHGLINQVAAQEQQIEVMLASMKTAGIVCQPVDEMRKFDAEQMNRLVD